MSFRLKLGIGFSSVLLLMVLAGLISWWGMDSALSRQTMIYQLNSTLEDQFNKLVREEQAFANTEDLLHSRAVFQILARIRGPIHDVLSQPLEAMQQETVENLLDALKDYEESFSAFITHDVDMRTMKSRMLQESKRLISNGSELSRAEADMAVLQHLMGEILIAEKNYLLSGSAGAATEVVATVRKLREKAEVARENFSDNELKLRAFRIATVADVYQEIFSNFIKEKEELQQAALRMEQALSRFTEKLAQYIARETAIAGKQVAILRLVSLCISLLAVGLGIFATIFLSGRITRPIEKLKHSAAQIVSGNLDTSVVISSRDEIGELGHIFNQMAGRLKESFTDIEQYRDHLEELVRERTLALEKENFGRREVEAALRASEENLSLIIEESPMGIILWGMDFQVTRWNQAAERIFGYPAAEAMGRQVAFIVPPQAQAHVETVWQQLITQKEDGSRSRNENITSKGDTILCDWYNTPLVDSAGEHIGVLSLVEDVTTLVRTEQELLKVKKIESTGVLAGGIAHDFNNILTAILGNINLSLMDQELTPRTRALLKAAEKASVRAQTLTQQLLTFAKGGDPVKEATDLGQVIMDSANFILHGSSIACSYAIPEDLWYVTADKGQISQVIQNIVLNAVQAMPGGGHLSISCTNIEPGTDEFMEDSADQRFVRIDIADSGGGIPAELMEKIFDPYFSNKPQGSGLGLAITLSIINKHHGRIGVHSAPDGGAVFSVYLPASEVTEAIPVTAGADSQVPGKKARILIMDDEQMVLDVLATMLQAVGHEVLISRDGDTCIHLYEESLQSTTPIDLIIMDLTIPGGKGGKETVQEILQRDRQARVIVSSGYSNDPVMAHYAEYGFCGAVSKPFCLDELSSVINTVLARQESV